MKLPQNEKIQILIMFDNAYTKLKRIVWCDDDSNTCS